MKVNRGALIFIGIVLVIVALVAGFVWFSSLFKPSPAGQPNAVQDFFSSLFPFGNGTNKNGQGGAAGNGAGGNGTEAVPDLREVSAGPIAGFHFETDGTLVYGERETGHIYKTTVDSLSEIRLTNTTIPAITRMVWLSDGVVVLEYAGDSDSVRNYIASFSTTTPDQALAGHFLPAANAVLPDTAPDMMLMVTKTAAGAVVTRAPLAGGSSATVFASPLSAWTVFSSEAGVYAETAPSSYAGFLYRVNPKGGFSKIIGSAPGLMALPDASGRYVAYSASPAGGLSLAVLDTQTGQSYASPVTTFAEKCSWGGGEHPSLFCGVPSNGVNYSVEQWYAGVAASSDDAWLIAPETGIATVIKQLAPNANEPIDMYQPAVSPDGSYAAFLNKTDLSLWLLKLK